MKAAPFAYVRPGTTAEALEELSRDGAKVIAGGQSLVPVLAMRLARPAALVDINAIEALQVLEDETAGVRIGATVRQREAQRNPATSRVPLLRMALPWIGHRELRSRGTVCGSLAHADPAAELPAVACSLEAAITIAGPGGERTVAAEGFFTAAMTTSAGSEELITSVRFPHATEQQGFGFAEIGRRHGDFALAGVAIRVEAQDPARPSARITCFGVSDTPVVRDDSTRLSEAVAAAGPDTPEIQIRTLLAASAHDFATEVVDTGGDEHGSRAYRQQLIAALSSRELARAYIRATRDGTGRTGPDQEKP
ncbi:xanthine dehydrogenase family protein subunit M [Sinomonas notoginsengisoli]|uniref:FAD binding domain-containing protein n=1 Tax=Sinomonas notoginsengisoli TaxID=1457311 RepID=UPI001F3C3052|nr:FAD binding domain-containing protein [Sinomonas notoginsengisoli]